MYVWKKIVTCFVRQRDLPFLTLKLNIIILRSNIKHNYSQENLLRKLRNSLIAMVKRSVICIFLLLISYSSVAGNGPACDHDPAETFPSFSAENIPSHIDDTLWVAPSASPAAVALVVHGFNVKPSKMNAIVSGLVKKDILVLRACLTGHGGDREKLDSIEPSVWLNDLYYYYCMVKERAEPQGLPVIFTGFSLGCLAVVDLVAVREDVYFDRFIWFAPALTLRRYTHLIKLGRVFGKRLVIPSKTPGNYHAYDGVPIAAYDALFALVRYFRRTGYKKLHFPALIFIDPEDEFVSYRRLNALIRDYGLESWEVIRVSNEASRLLHPFHHLIIDADAVGPGQWLAIQRYIDEYLDF